MLNVKKFRKAISAVTMLATVVALSGVAMLATTVKGAPTGPIVDGDLISSNAKNSDGTPTVASLDVYVVKLINGKKFKRIILNPSVFTSYQHLKWDNIREVDQAVMDSYVTSSLARVDGDQKVWALTPLGDTGAKSWINLSAVDFLAAGSDPDSIYTINAVDSSYYVTRADIATVDALKAFYKDGTLPDAPVTAALSATLAASNPATQTLVAGQGNATLAEFQLTGTATVKGITLERMGISADDTLTNVYLYDADTGARLTDAASVSNGVITFSDLTKLFDVAGSKTISVRADIKTDTSGQTVGVKVTGVTTTVGSVAGLPLTANLHSIANAPSLSVVKADVSVVPAANIDAGVDQVVWQGSLAVENRDALLSRIAFRQIGSIAATDINNFKLYVDGAQVATAAALDDNGYVTFTAPKALKTGSHVVKVMADVVGGSGRTIEMSLRGAQDISVTDTQYNVGVVATAVTSFPLTYAALTVSKGSLNITKATDSASGDILKGASDVSLATFDVKAYGEPVKVETLKVGVLPTGGLAKDITIQNVRLLVDGTQVGSTNAIAADGSATFTTNFTVDPSKVVKLEVHADAVDSEDVDDINAGTVTALQAKILAGGTASLKTSLGSTTVNTADGNTLSITSAGLAVSKTANYGDQTVVVPATAYKIGSFQLTGGTTDDINLSSFEVTLTGADAFALADLSNVYVKYGSTDTNIKALVASSPTSFNVNYALKKGEVLPVEIYATIAGAATNADPTADTLQTKLKVYGTTASTGTAVSSSSVAGQTITAVQTGQLAVTLSGSTPAAGITPANTTAKTAAYDFQAVNDTYTIKEATVSIADASTVSEVQITDGTTTYKMPAATSVAFTGMNFAVAPGTTKTLTVNLVLGTVGAGAGKTGSDVKTILASYKYTTSGGATATVSPALAGNGIYVYRAVPTIAKQTVSTTSLTNGTNELMKFQVTGDVAWNQMIVSVTPTTAAITAGTVKLYEGATLVATGTAAGTDYTFAPTGEQKIGAGKIYTVKADVTGAAAGASVVTKLDNPSVYAASVAAAGVAATSTFVWSDLSGAPHSTTSTDWTGEYGVLELPISQSLSF